MILLRRFLFLCASLLPAVLLLENVSGGAAVPGKVQHAVSQTKD